MHPPPPSSPELSHLPKLKLCPIEPSLSTPPPAPGTPPHPTFCLCGFDDSRDLIQVESYSTRPAVTGYFSTMPSTFILLEQVSGFPPRPLFLKLYLFIYFWPRWVFVAARGLSLVAASGGYSSLRSTGSRCVGFSSCSTWAQ